jgi:hypothetical protein
LGRPTIDSGGNRSRASDSFEQQLRGDEFIVGYDGSGSIAGLRDQRLIGSPIH